MQTAVLLVFPPSLMFVFTELVMSHCSHYCVTGSLLHLTIKL